MENVENLFDNPTTLRDPLHFVGRRFELERIFNLVKSRQNISLVGPRRIGKTSLLTCLRSPAIQEKFAFNGSRFLFLYLDLQKHSMKKKEHVEFLGYICQALIEQAQLLKYPIDERLAYDDLFDKLLTRFKRDGWYPVLIMDAFDEIITYQPINENIFGFLRSEGGVGKISYITASMDDPSEIFHRHMPTHVKVEAPFYNIFASIRLAPFSLDEAHEFLLQTSAKGGLPFNEDEVDWVIKQAGTHPYLLQQVATLLFEAKRVHTTKKIDFRRIQKEVQRNVFSHFEDSWRMLNGVDPQALQESIVRWEDEDEELEENDEHDICPEFSRSELFYRYLHETGKIEIPLLSTINDRDFKRILALLYDPEELGKSDLVKIPFIATRIEQQQASTLAARGKIVRDTLEKALESLKGQGERTDESRDWIHYNILYYRYFMIRHDMSQDMVASKLGISERQYYRFFPKALGSLKNALHTMDAEAALSRDDL